MAAQGTNLHGSEIKVLSSASQVQEIILSVYSDTFRSRNSIKIQRPSERYQNITLLSYDGNFTGRTIICTWYSFLQETAKTKSASVSC